MKKENWWDDCKTQQDFIDVLPMYMELSGMMDMALFIGRKLARQTKERMVIKHMKKCTNISLKRIKEIVRGKEEFELEWSFARIMYFQNCDDNGYLNIDYAYEEYNQVLLYLEYWDSI